MELLRAHKRKSLTSEVLYVVLNLTMVAVVLGVLLITQSLLLAIATALLSKWRVLAVRPRYWMAHIQTNLVDIIVGVAMTTLMYVASGQIIMQLVIAALYATWLLVIKPRSKRAFMVVQAGTALFLGVLALSSMTYDGLLIVQVLGCWLIGYAATRHILSTYDEAYRSILSLMWGFMVAQLGWLFYHWTFAYSLPGFGGIKITQGAIIISLISFLVYKFYENIHKNQTVRIGEMLLPTLLTGSSIIVLLLVFNSVSISGA